VGGYRDYFDEQTLAAMDRMTEERLSPSFGYTEGPRKTSGGASTTRAQAELRHRG
jgi:hypothetical protein